MTGDANINYLTVYQGNLVFVASSSSASELWSYDGTTLTQFADPNGESQDLAPWFPIVYGDDLYVYGYNDSAPGYTLWQFNGEAWVAITDPSLLNVDNPVQMVVYNSKLYFQGNDGMDTQLWSYDGSSLLQVSTQNSGNGGTYATSLNLCGTRLCFSGYDGDHGMELWSTDGTQENTAMVTDNVVGTDSSGGADSFWYWWWE